MTSFGSPTAPKRVLNKRNSALPQGMPQLGSWLAVPSVVVVIRVRRRASSRLLLVVDVGERLPVDVADDEAGVGLLDGPRRREAALGHGPLEHARRAVRFCLLAEGPGRD
jgi:hypothetical protein